MHVCVCVCVCVSDSVLCSQQGGIPLSLSVSNIPQGTQYQCVFAFDGSVAPRATAATVINSTQVMCVSPTVEELPVFSLGQGVCVCVCACVKSVC